MPGSNEELMEILNDYIYKSSLSDHYQKLFINTDKRIIKDINDDGDDNIKGDMLENKNNKLTEEEIKMSICKESPEVYFRNNNNKLSSIYTIGTTGRYTDKRNDQGLFYIMIVGYRINNKSIYSNEEMISNVINKSILLGNLEYVIQVLDTGKFKIVKKNDLESKLYINTLSNFKSIKKYLAFKLKNTLLSGKVFGLAKSKEKLVGSIVNIQDFEFGNSSRLGTDTYYATIYDPNIGKNVKICICDLELVIPNFKGYNFPKDKTIMVGSTVVLKNNRNNINKVVTVYPNPHSRMLNRNSKSRALDVLLITDPNGVSNKVYAKNVKLIV